MLWLMYQHFMDLIMGDVMVNVSTLYGLNYGGCYG